MAKNKTPKPKRPAVRVQRHCSPSLEKEIESRLREATRERDLCLKLNATGYCVGLAKGRVAALDDLATWIALNREAKENAKLTGRTGSATPETP